jgi:hypothetical protein
VPECASPPAVVTGGLYACALMLHRSGRRHTVWSSIWRAMVQEQARFLSHGTSTRQIQLQREVADVVQVAILNAPLIDWEARK